MTRPSIFKGLTHFIWDEHNQSKNRLKHRVSVQEYEEVFADPQIEFANESVQDSNEERWAVIGRTKEGRELLVIFTIRGAGIRIISARPAHQKERRKYDQA